MNTQRLTFRQAIGQCVSQCLLHTLYNSDPFRIIMRRVFLLPLLQSDSAFSDAHLTPAMSMSPVGTPLPLQFEEVSVSIEPLPDDSLRLEEALEDSRPTSAFSDNEVVLEQPHRLTPLPRRWATSHSKLSSLRALNSSSRQAQYGLKICNAAAFGLETSVLLLSFICLQLKKMTQNRKVDNN